MAEKGEKGVKKEILSVPILEIRPVTGKTFGFARLADDRGGNAFVSPPLMREIEWRGPLPRHAIVEMAEKGLRVIELLRSPKVRFVWEGNLDEERMIALAPEIARKWADFKELNTWKICGVSDYGHAEFSALWSAACAAGEAGKFLSKLDKEFIASAQKAEVMLRLPRLFSKWQSALENEVRKERERLGMVTFGGKNPLDETGEILHTPWWLEYATPERQAEVLAVARPISEETRRMVGQKLAELKMAEDARPSLENARDIAFWRSVIARANISGLELSPREDKAWLNPLVIRFGDQEHIVSGAPYRQIRDFADWLKGLGQRKAALRVQGRSDCFRYVSYTEEEIEAIIAKEDDEKAWHNLFAKAMEAHLVQRYGSHVSSPFGYCEVGGVVVSESFFKAHTTEDGLWLEEIEKYRAWGCENEVLSWERIETPACSFGELERLVGIADVDAVKRDLHRHNPVTDPAKEERTRLLAEENRLKEEAEMEKIRQRRLREEGALLEARSLEERKKLSDISLVRKNWENMLPWVTGSRRYQGLHPEARELLEEFRTKAEKLWETRKGAHFNPEATGQTRGPDKSDFLSKGAWDALDGLKL